MYLPKIAIILVNWNNITDTIDCINSLLEITYSNVEIVLVDNASKANDATVLKEKYGDTIIVIENRKNYGFAEGCNIGIRDALKREADYFVLLNNDTVVAPDFLEPLVEEIAKDGSIGIAGGKVYCHEIPNMIWFAGGVIDYRNGETPIIGSGATDNGQFENVIKVDWICGCYMLITRKVIEDVGLLDKRFFFGWEDVDICVRATKRGYKIIFVPGSKIWHKTMPIDKQKRLTGLPVYYATRGRFIFLEKHFTKWHVTTSSMHFILKLPRTFWDYSRLLGTWNVPIYLLAGIWGYVKRTPRKLVK